MSGKRYVPLESNPQVLTDYARGLGADVSAYAFCDVYGLDDELLSMVPSPILSVVLLYPITEELEGARGGTTASEIPEGLWYIKQTIGNACGTIAVLHAILNNLPEGPAGGDGSAGGGAKAEGAVPAVPVAEGSFLAEFAAATAGLSPAERAAFLEAPPPGAPDLEASHAAAASRGNTEAPLAESSTDLHFVAFVHKGGRLWELDGRKAGPVDHGPCSPGTLLADVAGLVRREFIPNSKGLEFSMIALARAEE